MYAVGERGYETDSLSIKNIVDEMVKTTGVKERDIIKKKMHELIPIEKPPLNEYLNLDENKHALLGSTRGYTTFIRDNLINSLKTSGGLKRKNKNKKSINKNMKITMKRSRKVRKTKKAKSKKKQNPKKK